MKKILTNKKHKDFLILGIVVLLFLLGLFVENRFYLDVLISIVYFAVLSCGWNIMCGYVGELSLGHVAFLGLGQYSCVLLYTRLGLTPWVGMFLGSAVAMLLAFLIGVLALRLKGPFFTLSTIALATVLQIFVVKLDGLTNGAAGVTIPYEPSIFNMIFEGYKPIYFLFILLLIAVVLVTIYINHSKLGSNLIAIRENDTAAASLGVNVFRNKVIALLISAFFTSIAGCIYAQYVLFIDPVGSFTTTISEKTAILTLIGGSGTVFGPVVGSIIMTPLEIWLRTTLGSTYQGAYLIIYGVILIFVILVIPKGIVGTLSQVISKKRSKKLERELVQVQTESKGSV